MSNFSASKLSADTIFDGFKLDQGGISLREISSFEIVSIALAHGETLKGKVPQAGQWIKTKSRKLIWTGQNQYFAIQDGFDPQMDEKISHEYGQAAYCSLQTDGWGALEISGPLVHDVLERFTPLNLREKTIGFGARTSAHHIALIIMKTGEDSYEMLTPRSSSKAFLDALTHITQNVT